MRRHPRRQQPVSATVGFRWGQLSRFIVGAWRWRDKQAHSHCANQLNYSDDSLSVDITLLQNVNTDMLAGQIGFFFFRDLKGRVSHSETESSTAGCWPQCALARLSLVTFCYLHNYMQFGSGKELQLTKKKEKNPHLSVFFCNAWSSRWGYYLQKLVNGVVIFWIPHCSLKQWLEKIKNVSVFSYPTVFRKAPRHPRIQIHMKS